MTQPDGQANDTAGRGVTVSVIIPTYRSRYLAVAVGSALQQSIPSIEIIIVDDGSGEDVEASLGPLAGDPRVRIMQQSNQGAAAARNLGARAARGPYLAFLDDDDAWCEAKLVSQVAALARHPEAGLCFCDGVRIDEHGATISGFREFKQWRPTAGHGNAAEVVIARGTMPLGEILRGVAITSSLLVRKEIFDSVGGFSLIPAGQDIDLVFRLSRAAALVSLQAQLFHYRLTSSSISRSGVRSLIGERAFAERLLEYELSRAERRTVHRLLGAVECNLAYANFKRRDAGAARRSALRAVFRYRYLTGWSFQVLGACLAPRFLVDGLLKLTGRQA